MSDDNGRFRRRTFIKATAAGAGTAGFAGCLGDDDDDADDGDDTAPADDSDDGDDGDDGELDVDEIIVGGLQPYTGPFALYGEAHTLGIEYAFDEINANGGVLGAELVHDPVDTESDPSEAVTILTEKVEQDDIIAAVGPVSSDVGVNVAPEAEMLEVPIFMHAAGDLQVLTRDSRYTFRTALPPAPTFIESVYEEVQERGYTEVGAIVGDYAWGHGAEIAIEEFFGDDITYELAPVGEDDFAPYLRDMPDGLEVLVGSGHPPGLNDMFSDMLELDMDVEMFTAAVSPPEANYNALGDDVQHGFTFGHLADYYSDEYQDIAHEFNEETGEFFGPSQAAAYVTGYVIAEAIEAAGVHDRSAVADEIRNIELDTIYAEPLQYTEWGEIDQFSLIWSQFELEAPDHYPDGDFDLAEEFRTPVLDGVDPEEYQ